MHRDPCRSVFRTHPPSKDEAWGRTASPHFVGEIEKRSKPFVPGEDRFLFREGDTADRVFLVKCGEVVLTVRSHGEVVAEVSLGAGALPGISAVTSEKPYGLSARAGADAEICELSAPEFNKLIAGCAQFSFEVSQILAAETLSALKLIAKLVR